MDKFQITFPCYAISGVEYAGPVRICRTDGSIAVVILTDDDLCDRYRREHGHVGAAIKFDMLAQLALFLNDLPKEITHAAFDPKSKTSIVVPIADLFDIVLAG